jgi:hypothetical protein
VRAFGAAAAPKICCQATKSFVALVRFVMNRRLATDRHLGLLLHPISLPDAARHIAERDRM